MASTAPRLTVPAVSRSETARTARRRRRERRRRLLLVVGAVLVVAVGVGVVVLSRGGGGESPAVATGTTVPSVASTVPSVAPTTVPGPPTTVPAPTTTTEPDPQFLPQTPDKPSATSARFTAGAAALWQAIVTDDPEVAMPFFFPLGAYEQVKAISNPESDWRTRLVAAYREDIHALHNRLGSRASAAQFQGIDVPEGQATWVQPGEEYNKGSYWRVYNAALRYTADGQVGSFPIASMISWRGEWYVVHLNSIR
jgi:hypothetical protein